MTYHLTVHISTLFNTWHAWCGTHMLILPSSLSLLGSPFFSLLNSAAINHGSAWAQRNVSLTKAKHPRKYTILCSTYTVHYPPPAFRNVNRPPLFLFSILPPTPRGEFLKSTHKRNYYYFIPLLFLNFHAEKMSKKYLIPIAFLCLVSFCRKTGSIDGRGWSSMNVSLDLGYFFCLIFSRRRKRSIKTIFLLFILWIHLMTDEWKNEWYILTFLHHHIGVEWKILDLSNNLSSLLPPLCENTFTVYCALHFCLRLLIPWYNPPFFFSISTHPLLGLG